MTTTDDSKFSDFTTLEKYAEDHGDIKWKDTVGFVTYKRTYSRRLQDDDPDSKTESFKQTIMRVIKACNTQLDMKLTPDEQCEYFDVFANFKALPAGRFMWQLGTKTVNKYGLLSLQNCAFTNIDTPVDPFCWVFDCLMLGSGVGYNIQHKYVNQLPKPRVVTSTRTDTNDADFIVPDSREGWVSLLRYVLTAHFPSRDDTPSEFTYSCICLRSKGALIKGFGGTASGPEYLCSGIADISKVINARAELGESLRPIDCLDIMNLIARTVISGNVRRSAQIAIGDHDDIEFLKAKRWDLGGIPNWRCYSNNSVVCDDTSKLPQEFWDGYKGNGECYGLINLEMSKKMGRTGEIQYPDPNVCGFNPSLRKGTLVLTINGIKPIEQLEDTFFMVRNLSGGWSVARCWMSGVDKPLYKITLSNGKTYYSTAEHKWPVLSIVRTAQPSKSIDSKSDSKLETVTEESGDGGDGNVNQGESPPVNATNTTNANVGVNRTATPAVKSGDWLPYRVSTSLCTPKDATESYSDGFCLGLLYNSPTAFVLGTDDLPAYVWAIEKNEHTECVTRILIKWLAGIDSAVVQFSDQKTHTVYSARSAALTTYMKQFGCSVSSDFENNTVKLPQSMYTGTEVFRRGFIDATYTLNGELDETNTTCTIVNAHKLVVEGLWNVLGFYGVSGVVKEDAPVYVLEFPAGLFARLFPVSHTDKRKKLLTIASDTYGGVDKIAVVSCELTELKENVWDVSVYDDAHMFALSHCYTGNCGEQSLESRETCCLQEMFLPNIDSQEELTKVAKMMYRLAKHSMRLPCHQKSTEKIVHKNMRMGIGVTGILQAVNKMDWLGPTYEDLRTYDKEYSEVHGFPTSIKLTTVKPSGCVDPDTVVKTSDGCKTMRQIFADQGIDIDNAGDGQVWYDVNKPLKVLDCDNNAQDVTKLFDNGVQETVTFNVGESGSVTCTPEHKFMLMDGTWKRACDLTTGDVIKSY
jgi:hypothetical protein